jgi:hypothetical protein
VTFFYVDDQLHSHDKIEQAGNAAMGLWVRAGSWSACYLKDGFVPYNIVRRFGTKQQAERLVEVGLWDRMPDGYGFVDWDVWQPTKDEVIRKRAKRAEAGRKGGFAKAARTIQRGDLANG